MGREVTTELDVRNAQLQRDAAGSVAAGQRKILTPDDYSGRLIKYIPSEVIGVYLSIDAVLKTAGEQIPKDIIAWGVFIFMLAMTPVYLWRQQKVKKWQQLIIATVSFVVWVFTLGGPFIQLGWYSSLYGACLLPLYTFSIATFKAQK